MMWWNGMGWGAGWAGWLMMILVMLAVWALVVGAVVMLVRGMRTGDQPPTGTPAAPPAPDAIALLDGRLARGEVTVEEYQRVRDVLAHR